MGIKKNNLGQQSSIEWGHLGKRKVYKNEAFKVIEVEKKKPYDWSQKLKPWGAMKKGKLSVMMKESGAPTPPPPPGEIWNETTTNWESTTDNWNNI